MGLYKPVDAALDATVGLLTHPGQGWANRYHADRLHQDGLDRYDALHYAPARNAGALAGAGGAILLSDGLTAAPTAKRIAPLAEPILGVGLKGTVKGLRPWAAAVGGGAGVSLAGQAASDYGARRVSGPATYTRAALGGGVGGILTFARSPAAGAGVDAAIKRGFEAATTHTQVPIEALANDMGAGAVLGLVGHLAGGRWADSLHWSKGKGPLGEKIAAGHSKLIGEKVFPKAERRYPTRGGATIVDLVTDHGPIEAKFGGAAKLRPRQKEAVHDVKDYRVRHYLKDDIGKAVGGVLGLFGAHQNALNRRK